MELRGFFFSSRRRHTRLVSDWSSDVCSSDLKTRIESAWVMDQGGLNPSFLIGGVAQNFGNSFRVTDSDYVIIEADEYDTAYFDKGPKFMHYLPELAIVNNIEFDHADIYRDLDAVKLAFRRFMNLVPENGRLIAGWDSPNVRTVVESFGEKLFTRLETFGTDSSAK